MMYTLFYGVCSREFFTYPHPIPLLMASQPSKDGPDPAGGRFFRILLCASVPAAVDHGGLACAHASRWTSHAPKPPLLCVSSGNVNINSHQNLQGVGSMVKIHEIPIDSCILLDWISASMILDYYGILLNAFIKWQPPINWFEGQWCAIVRTILCIQRIWYDYITFNGCTKSNHEGTK